MTHQEVEVEKNKNYVTFDGLFLGDKSGSVGGDTGTFVLLVLCCMCFTGVVLHVCDVCVS